MRTNISLLIFALILAFATKAEEYTVKGIYQGKNLFIQNSITDDEKGEFCITAVKVNDVEIPDEVRSSAFVISLDEMNLSMGQSINIVFTHENKCAPLIINPEVLKPLITYELKSYNLVSNHLNFETTNEAARIPFVIEEYRWGKWLEIAQKDGIGGPDDNEYKVRVYPHNGLNLYRIKQIDHMERIEYSDTLSFNMEIEEVHMTSKNIAKGNIEFSAETLYELYNEFGERVRFGGGDSIDISDLENGKYYISWDDKVAEIDVRN
jgi:hypothetical protein